MRVAIGFGANLGERERTVRRAVTLLSSRVGELLELSELFETPPLVWNDQDAETVPKYINAVAVFETSLLPKEIFQLLRGVERELGRQRELEIERWASRVIDVDLLALDNLTYQDEDLIVPHAEMHKREFVLIPFRQVWPDWVHPIFNETLDSLLARLRVDYSPAVR